METTVCNLQGFINEVIEVLRGLPHLNYIPDTPDINPSAWPYVGVYMTDGITKATPAGLVQTDLNNVTIAMVVPLDDMSKAVEFFLPYREQVPAALIKEFILNNNSDHAQHIGAEITVSMSPIEWPQGQEMFGLLVGLVGVKIQNEIT